MANRKRYKEFEQLMTCVLIGVVLVFALYLIFAGLGLTAMKVLTAIIAIVGAVLSLVFLYICGEFHKRRSRWLVLAYACTLLCLVASLVLRYPSPAPTAADIQLPNSSTSAEK